MKKLMHYIIIFILTVIVLFFALVVSSKIPHSAIEENLKDSVEFYRKKAGIYRVKNKRVYSYIHYFADTRKLNIIYCLDSKNPIESVLWAKYYQEVKMDINKDFIELVENPKEPNTQYLRYWNGCMLFLRPLLTRFNMEQIYLINKIVLATLTLVLIIMLFKKSKKLAFIFLLALFLTSSWYVTFCIEYSVMFYVMLITSIIAIIIDSSRKKSNDDIDETLSKLFLITGIVATFFDFLTTEILTIFVPLIFILVIRKEENRLISLKSTFKFVVKVCILWLIGYIGMWLAKWVLASLILHINAFEYVRDDLVLRFNGLQGLRSQDELYNYVITRNLFAIPLMYIIKVKFYKWEVKTAIIIAIILLLLLTNWKELKNKKYLLFLICIGIMPYLRYLILANHSFRHVMFTFRDQIITIMVILYIIIDCLNYPLLFKDVSVSKLIKYYKKNRLNLKGKKNVKE